ncbi:MAG: hypothetical protein WD278_18120 [Pirellulales bacterium]
MIRYAIALDELKERIAQLKPTWFERAKDVLEGLPDEPSSSDFTGLWSEIKDLYTELQHSKCAFCEKPLEGRIEQDVEHFRPKSNVAHWDPPEDLVEAGITVEQPADGSKEPGYRFLAYHPFNYATACKNCNSVFKGNLFPIAKARKGQAKRPPALSTERPYLLYPIGDLDDDPEDLITFVGPVPQAAKASGHDRFRGQVTIAIFKLDDPVERRVFYEGRARAIQLLFLNLEAIRSNPDPLIVGAAQSNVGRMLSESEPYTSCLRCFHKLYQDDRAEAVLVFTDITELLDSISPP